MRLAHLTLLFAAACKGSVPAPNPSGTAPGGGLDADGDGSPEAADCDDTDPLVRPGVPEACDGVDTDCDPGTGEEGLATVGDTTSTDLQAVIDAAVAGDTVSVCAGLWAGPITVREAISVRGIAGAAETVLQGTSSAAALTLAAGEVGGFSLSDGLRGVVVEDGATALLADTVISGFDAGSEDGGGIVVGDGATLTLDEVVVLGNSAQRGGGMVIGDGATVTLLTSFIDGNLASDLAGGVLLYPGATFTGGTVRQNAATRGGGFALLGDAALDATVISANNANASGGGLHVEGPGPVTLTDVLVSANTAQGKAQDVTQGGGIYADNTALSLVGDTTLTLNVAWLGGGMALRGDASATGGLLLANVALLQGGGVHAGAGGGQVTLDGTILRQNAALLSGGGLQVDTGSLVGDDLILDANQCEGLGGGFAQAEATTLTLNGGQVITNTAAAGGGGAMAGENAAASDLVCTAVDFGADATSNLPSTLQVGSDVVNRSGVTTLSCTSDRGCQ